MDLMPACNSEPLAILNFYLAEYEASYGPANIVFSQTKYFLRENVEKIDIAFSLDTIADETNFTKLLANVVDSLEGKLARWVDHYYRKMRSHRVR